MNIVHVFQSFQTQEQAIEYLETIRWRGKPVCPYCQAEKVCRHVSGDRKGQRWQCEVCSRAFAVTVGTIFHGTHIQLRNWYLVIALMLNAKKSASACQIARDIGIRRATVWSMMHRVRIAMASDADQRDLLHGIVEADETYVGGKPRKSNRRGGSDRSGYSEYPKRSGRGGATAKTPVLGAMERGGRVIARPARGRDVSAMGIGQFIGSFVDQDSSLLITDEFASYRPLERKMKHAVINHSYEYANGQIHTNNIEGFWALVKRAHYGQHHHYSHKYMHLYIAEACYKFNNRRNGDGFRSALNLMVAA